MTEEKDRELEGWRDEWRRIGAAPDAEAAAIRVRRDTRRLWMGAVRLVVAGTFGVAVAVWVSVRYAGVSVIVTQMFLVAWMAVFITRWFGMREGLFAERPVEEHIELTRRRLRAAVRWSRFDVASIAVLVVAVDVIWTVSAVWGHHPLPLRGMLALAAALVFAIIRSRQRSKRSTRELAQLEQLVG